LFSSSIREVAEKVAKAVNKKEQELSSQGGAPTSSSTHVEFDAIKSGADTLAKNVNDKLEEIEQVVAQLPGTDKTIQQLLDEIKEAEIKNEQARELLEMAQEEAQKWLTFVDESNKRLATKNLERLGNNVVEGRSHSSSGKNKRQKRGK
tara:strand:- start:131 stop:577 length:447 start_codon:yes stop_codon:yes gene_type:complete